jgi:uracil-DNA glycosylase family 4
MGRENAGMFVVAANRWDRLNRQIVSCESCPRLRAYCQQVAVEKKKSYRDWTYWGRPAPNFGDPQARLLIVGLAPAAHGANRTGRMFTGDRSGDWLYRALYKAGFANQPQAIDLDDGLQLRDCAITAACHCAPPGNKPSVEELAHCRPWLDETFDLLPVRVILSLGQLGWNAALQQARRREWLAGKSPKFGHGASAALAGGRTLLGSYHPSQQNTFTGKLTEPMLDAVFAAAKELLDAEMQ